MIGNPHEFDTAALRASEFPWAGRDPANIVYLNNAATGPLPARSVQLLDDWTHRRARPWTITDHDTIFPALDRTRQCCAALVHATPQEIALMPNTSYGLSLAAQALPLRDGDVIVSPAGEFPTVVACWRAPQPERRLSVHEVPLSEHGPDEEALIQALDATDAKVLAVSWVGYGHGVRLDLERLGAACRERGVFFVVDAMQGLGATDCDVRACGIDVLACGGFKWLLAPWGAGFAYVRRELIPHMNPPAIGWMFGPWQEANTKAPAAGDPLHDDARRFEVMTLPSQDLAALGESVDLLLSLGLSFVQGQVERLASRLIERLGALPHVHLVTPHEVTRRLGIVSVRVPDALARSKALRAHGAIHSLREGMLRFSPHCYNTMDEVDEGVSRLGAILAGRVSVPTS
ncbi:MAG: aminotransferase class V-fold PLP-dependent enzyme [Gemmatimonadaceae bacterium]